MFLSSSIPMPRWYSTSLWHNALHSCPREEGEGRRASYRDHEGWTKKEKEKEKKKKRKKKKKKAQLLVNFDFRW